jgi:membrane fusion protein, multidrug efflux system
MSSSLPSELHKGDGSRRSVPRIPLVIAVGVIAILILASALAWHAQAGTNQVALASSPKPVTGVAAKAEPFRTVHTYVGSLRPWVEAHVGPQFISAYVDTVLVRPGAVVKKGEVLATLDCRDASAQTAAASAEARAIATRQLAVEHEAARTSSLLAGGFVSSNESEILTARSGSEAAELAAQKAHLSRNALYVNDCVLRAPFDGEVSVRLVDPGSFVRPGTEMVGVVDRTTVRMTADAPEDDFDSIAPGTRVDVHVLAIDLHIPATITRRAPNANPGTRTVHFEIDIENGDRRTPVDTTGQIRMAVGKPIPATAVPIKAVKIEESKATLFTVVGNVAHLQTEAELGEVGSEVFFAPDALPAGTMVVVEGQALLEEGDRVVAKPPRAEKKEKAE